MRPNTVFLHVDVETTGFDPITGQLLSIGLVAVLEDEPAVVLGHLYRRAQWDSVGPQDRDTMTWWAEQDASVHREAFEIGADRLSRNDLAVALTAFIVDLADTHHAIVVPVADPGAFDRKWLDHALNGHRSEALSYRTLCLRSMTYGRDGRPFNENRSERAGFIAPEFAHHPLSDAISQATYLAGEPLVGSPVVPFYSQSVSAS